MKTRSLIFSWHADLRWGADPEPDLFYRYFGLGWVSVGRSRLAVQDMPKDSRNTWMAQRIRELESKIRNLSEAMRGRR